MPNKKILFFAILIGVFFVSSAVQAATTAVNGYAWSDNIGWIQMNPSPGGVFIDDATGDFSGYAWSDNIGWIDFAPASGFPEAPNYGAKVNWTSGEVSGWAKAVAGGTAGWDGWIKMRGTNPDYGVSINKTTGDFSGYAWGADVVGWIDFSQVTTGATTTPPYKEPTLSVSLTAEPSSGNKPLTSILTAVVTGTATGTITYKFDCNNDGIYEPDGVFTISETTKEYSCTYSNSGSYTAKVYVERGTLNDEATAAIAVGDPDGPPVVSITANPNPIDYNTSSTLSWSAVNADSCVASGAWSGAKNPVTGSESTGNLISDKTYTLTCTGPNGSASKSVDVQVNPAPIPTCTLSVNPSSGQSPLDVTLTASGSGGSGAGYEYRFDYTNDGTYDTLYSASNTSNHTYTTDSPTDIVATAEVKDSYGTTASCGTASIKIIGELFVSLNADPSSNPSPLTTDLTATVSGTESSPTINYTLWWDCDNSGTSVSEVTLACGDPNDPSIGVKYDAIFDTSITERHTYTNSLPTDKIYTAKVIVERGEAPSAQNKKTITVEPPRPYFWLNDLTPLHATIIENQPTATNETTVTVTPINNFDSNIVLSSNISSVILGATGNFSDSTLSSLEYSIGSKFKVNLPGTATPGTYTITITGMAVDGSHISTEEVILNIESVSTSEIWEF
ncbi:MAG: hypothetical protein HY773_00960 [Candidatus Terrybacteria bacterium]|nr:hypothetical protein [Candidatus Terrybacteria bacterium]